MIVDIKCPHCKNDTTYDLNYSEDYCMHCEKEITYGEMYSGKSRVEKRLDQIDKNIDDQCKEIRKETKIKLEKLRDNKNV